MKYLSKVMLCLPLLILNIEYQTNDSTDGLVNGLAIEHQRSWSLGLNKSHAEEKKCPPDVNDCMTIVGKKPPSMPDPFGPGNWGGGDGGGGGDLGHQPPPPEAPGDPGLEPELEPEPPKDNKCANGYTKSELDKFLAEALVTMAEMEREWNTILAIEGAMYGAVVSWQARHLQWNGYNYGKYIGSVVSVIYTYPMTLFNGYLSDGARNRILEQYHNDVKGCS